VGTVRYQQWDYVRLEDVVEKGKDYQLTVSFVMVDVFSIARIYPADVRVEKKAGTE
jgi:hypothetical protein